MGSYSTENGITRIASPAFGADFTARQKRVVEFLKSQDGYVTSDDIARNCGYVVTRQNTHVRKDIGILRESHGVPIVGNTRGFAYCWSRKEMILHARRLNARAHNVNHSAKVSARLARAMEDRK